MYFVSNNERFLFLRNEYIRKCNGEIKGMKKVR